MSEHMLSEVSGDLQGQGNNWGQSSLNGPPKHGTTHVCCLQIKGWCLIVYSKWRWTYFLWKHAFKQHDTWSLYSLPPTAVCTAQSVFVHGLSNTICSRNAVLWKGIGIALGWCIQLSVVGQHWDASSVAKWSVTFLDARLQYRRFLILQPLLILLMCFHFAFTDWRIDIGICTDLNSYI